MKKPTAAAIRNALPLTALQVGRPDFVCVVCGLSPIPTDGGLEAWRECDERDQPLDGAEAVVFLGVGHTECRRRLTDHPRLYVQIQGDPGFFPRLCGPCVYRDGRACQHPDLRANGGQGLRVELADPFHGVICMKGLGIERPIRKALRCAGFREKS